MSNTKFNIGDKVKVINYGSLMWSNDGNGIKKFDMMPELVGKTGIISNAHITQNRATYAIEGIPTKHAWYDDEQLEMVNKNPNTL